MATTEFSLPQSCLVVSMNAEMRRYIHMTGDDRGNDFVFVAYDPTKTF